MGHIASLKKVALPYNGLMKYKKCVSQVTYNQDFVIYEDHLKRSLMLLINIKR